MLRAGRGVVLAGSLGEVLEVEALSPDEQVEAEDERPGPVDVAGSDAVHVARLRSTPGHDRGIVFWLAFDELRNGTALTLVATLEIALRELA